MVTGGYFRYIGHIPIQTQNVPLSTGQGVEGHDGNISGEALLSTCQGVRLRERERGCFVMYMMVILLEALVGSPS